MTPRRRSSLDPTSIVQTFGRMPVATLVDRSTKKSPSNEQDEGSEELPTNTIETNRRANYASVIKTGNAVYPTLGTGIILAILSFFATPQGVQCFFMGVGFCTGFMSEEYILSNPWLACLRGTIITSIWSICTFVPVARYWDQLYTNNPGLRCQPNVNYNNVTQNLLDRAEVKLAMLSLVTAAIITNAIGVYAVVRPDGYLKVYSETPDSVSSCAWLVVSAVMYFLWIDAWAYTSHRFLHLPVIYKHIHKVHHMWKQPTAFVALALHPLEMLLLYSGVYAGIFVIPMHPAVLTVNLLYIHYFNVVDHSGVYKESWLPWQPSSLFHDDHHKLFHVNYGQSLTLFDRTFKTFYSDKQKYTEKTFSL